MFLVRSRTIANFRHHSPRTWAIYFQKPPLFPPFFTDGPNVALSISRGATRRRGFVNGHPRDIRRGGRKKKPFKPSSCRITKPYKTFSFRSRLLNTTHTHTHAQGDAPEILKRYLLYYIARPFADVFGTRSVNSFGFPELPPARCPAHYRARHVSNNLSYSRAGRTLTGPLSVIFQTRAPDAFVNRQCPKASDQ